MIDPGGLYWIPLYSLSPGETVPCAVFPDDDVVVTSLRANFAGVHTVRRSVARSGDELVRDVNDIPVVAPNDEVLWASPGAQIRRLPSTRLRWILTSTSAPGDVLGEYVLDHTATNP